MCLPMKNLHLRTVTNLDTLMHIYASTKTKATCAMYIMWLEKNGKNSNLSAYYWTCDIQREMKVAFEEHEPFNKWNDITQIFDSI